MTRLALLLAALLLPSPAAASSEPVRTDHLQSRLVAETTAAVPGSRVTLGLLLEHDGDWHTYWRNPGDSGLPTRLDLVLPDGVAAEAIAWPHPERFEVSDLVNFGYGARRLLPVNVVVPPDYAASTLPVRATASWLVCAEECIPGKADYSFELPVAAAAEPDPRWVADFAAARSAVPRPATVPLVLREDGDAIVLDLADTGATPARWHWFAETPNVVASGAGPQWRRGDAGWQARWPKDPYFTALPAEAVFVAVADTAVGDGPAGAAAWRYAATAAAAAAGAVAGPPPGVDRTPFGGVPLLVFAIAAVLLAATMAIVIRAALARRASPSRSEEIDR